MVLLVAQAMAMPMFVAEGKPDAIRLARAAWRAATVCAGHEALALPEVGIVVGQVRGGFAGRANSLGPTIRTWRDDAGNVIRTEVVSTGGLAEITLQDEAPRTIAHEVSHAWVRRGPPALVEGATNLLADCIAEQRPELFPAYPRRVGAFKDLVDLASWENPDDAGPERDDAYAASARLLRAVAELVPREQLWRETWTWEELDGLLEGAGERGQALKVVLAGGVHAQRLALGDVDGDGLDGLVEAAAGLDPEVTDSDGDGFSDASPLAPESGDIVLPVDGTAVCAGVAAGPLGARITAVAPRRDGAAGRVRLWFDFEAAPKPGADGARGVPAGASILVATSDKLPFARVRGSGLAPDTRCRSGAHSTVIVARGVELAGAEALSSAIERDAARLTQVLGIPRRLVLELGPQPKRISGMREQFLPRQLWERVSAGGDAEYLAALVTAWAFVVQTPAGMDAGIIEALARTLAPPPADAVRPWLAVDEASLEDWTLRAGRCGWDRVVQRTCPDE